MADRPTDLPSWATGTTVVVEPTLAERAAGWAVRQRVSSALLNGIFRSLGQWAEYFDRQSLKRYDSIDAMWAEGQVGVGETVSISEPSTAIGTVTTLASLGADVTAVATDGRRVYCTTTTIRRALARETGALLWSAVGTAQGGNVLAVDGRSVIRHTTSNTLVCTEPDTNVSRWSITYNSAVLGLAVLGSRLMVGSQGGAQGDGTYSLSLRDADTGASIWTVNENSAFAVALGGGDAYAAVTTDGSNLILRRYLEMSSTSPQAVTVSASTAARITHMVTDGELLFCARPQSTGGLVAYNARDIDVIAWQVDTISGGCDFLAVDDRYLYVHPVGATIVRVHDKRTGRLVRLVTVGADITGIACDGQYLYAARAGSADLVARVVPVRRTPRIWQRVDLNDMGRPLPLALIPGGA